MTNQIYKGWKIDYHPLFWSQYNSLVEEVKKLKQKLERDKFSTHSKTKLLKRIREIIEEKIPNNPNASYFRLTGDLKGYNRVKKMGLPHRYRLFFKTFDQEEKKRIIILWLGYPRKEGDKKDCYTVFKKMVERGEFSLSLESFLSEYDLE